MTKLDTLLLELEKLDGERISEGPWSVKRMRSGYGIEQCGEAGRDLPFVALHLFEKDADLISAAVNSNKVLREVIKIQREALRTICCETPCDDPICAFARQALEAAERVCEEKE